MRVSGWVELTAGMFQKINTSKHIATRRPFRSPRRHGLSEKALLWHLFCSHVRDVFPAKRPIGCLRECQRLEGARSEKLASFPREGSTGR